MSVPVRIVAAAVGVLLTAVLVVGSALPWTVHEDEGALVRLSWRAVGERVEECRTPSAEELASLPAHMRQREICEGRLAPFHLAVRLDGAGVFDDEIRPAGARGDRPAIVFQEYLVPSGEHRLEVVFAPVASARGGSAAPAALVLDETLVLPPRSIALVTRDADAGVLRLVAPSPAP